MNQGHIRNFAIIAHIDHGKSTLADRFIQICGGLSDREMAEQVLDSMDLEKERGITIKAQSVRLDYVARDGETYRLNLIDTPGHVDFSYEVSRSLTACDGAILVVDASQGVEAQTLAVCYAATDLGLEVIPVLNKMDLPAADPDRVMEEIEEVIGIDCSNAVKVSAKTGDGVIDVMESIVKLLPAPSGDATAPLKALIMDSWFDNYLGTISLIRIFDGTLATKNKICMMSTGRNYVAEQVGIFTPKRKVIRELDCGDVGYVICGVKDVSGAKVGDTVTSASVPTQYPLEGFQEIKPKVFAGLYPVISAEFEAFRDALEKLSLNDSSLRYEPETSTALGFGFRCGFLGLLHLEIVQERLEREYGLNLITTAPTVLYEVVSTDGQVTYVDNPAKLPDLVHIQEIREPVIEARILVPQNYIGAVMTLCIQKRGIRKAVQYLGRQVMLIFELPLNEVVLDFFDKLKSATKGYASLDYEFIEYRSSDMIKLDVLINGDRVDPLAILVHRDQSQFRARETGRQDASTDTATNVRCGDPGSNRVTHCRPRKCQGTAQECYGEVLRGRYNPKTQAIGKTERG